MKRFLIALAFLIAGLSVHAAVSPFNPYLYLYQKGDFLTSDGTNLFRLAGTNFADGQTLVKDSTYPGGWKAGTGGGGGSTSYTTNLTNFGTFTLATNWVVLGGANNRLTFSNTQTAAWETIQTNGIVTSSGGFVGNGTSLTNLNASSIGSGTVANQFLVLAIGALGTNAAITNISVVASNQITVNNTSGKVVITLNTNATWASNFSGSITESQVTGLVTDLSNLQAATNLIASKQNGSAVLTNAVANGNLIATNLSIAYGTTFAFNNSSGSWTLTASTNSAYSTNSGTATTLVASPVIYSPVSNTGLELRGNTNSFFQLLVNNTNKTFGASSDVVLQSPDGNNTAHFLDIGINGLNGGEASFTNGGDTYIYSQDSPLNIGSITNGALRFWAGGNINAPTPMAVVTNGDWRFYSTVQGSPSNSVFQILNSANLLNIVGTAAMTNMTVVSSNATLLVSNGGSWTLFISTNSSAGPVTGMSFVSGQYYTNTTTANQLIEAQALLTPASVAGMVQLAIESPTNGTNFATYPSAIGGITTIVTQHLSLVIGPGQWYSLTNRSSGAGDTAAPGSGQVTSLSGATGATGAAGSGSTNNVVMANGTEIVTNLLTAGQISFGTATLTSATNATWISLGDNTNHYFISATGSMVLNLTNFANGGGKTIWVDIRADGGANQNISTASGIRRGQLATNTVPSGWTGKYMFSNEDGLTNGATNFQVTVLANLQP